MLSGAGKVKRKFRRKGWEYGSKACKKFAGSTAAKAAQL